MVPTLTVGLVLALAGFRITRLVGWDDFPPVLVARAWATGKYVTRRGSQNAMMGISQDRPEEAVEYRRPLLAKFLGCAWCVGFWIALGLYAAWVFFPTETLYGSMPLALSAAIGILAVRDP